MTLSARISLLFMVAVWPPPEHDQAGPIAVFGTTPTSKLLGVSNATTIFATGHDKKGLIPVLWLCVGETLRVSA
jgi:hypothetical protein